jgi:protein transport protein SEC9
MKKFGFGKKSDEGGDEGNRTALFGRKKESPALPSDNPYAQQPLANDPYANEKYANMTPYQQARAALPSGPRNGGGVGLPSGPRGGAALPPPPIANGGYGSDKYGSTGGYGASRYDNNNGAYGTNQYNTGPRNPGGYGGLGRTNSTSTEDQRDALLSGAKDRYDQGPANSPSGGTYAQSTTSSYGGSTYAGSNNGAGNDDPGNGLFSGAQGRYDQRQAGVGNRGYGQSGSSSGSYGGYGEQRELTEKEEEDLAIQATKQQIKQTKQETLASTERSLALVYQAEVTGRGTLARLGAQGERLHNTEKNLDLAANHNITAQARVKELDTVNGSMFAIHVGNPFTSKKRLAAKEKEILDRHQAQRGQADITRKEEWDSTQQMEGVYKDLNAPSNTKFGQASAAERAKFTFKDEDESTDEEDKEVEKKIDKNVEAMYQASGVLNKIARRTGEVVDRQNKMIDRIAEKVSS